MPWPPIRRCLGRMAVVLALLAQGPARAEDRFVDDDGLDCFGARYDTVMEAVADAEAGDKIFVCPGLYEEQVVLHAHLALIGLRSGSRAAVLRPRSYPRALASPLSGNPVTAAVLIDAPRTRIENLEIDLGAADAMGCSPLLAAVYLRRSSGTVRNNRIVNARPNGRPDCPSGVGILVEGAPERGKVRVDGNLITGFQKAGIVATGPEVQLLLARSELTAGASATVANVVEATLGAALKAKRVDLLGRRSPVNGRYGTGLLLFSAAQSRVRRVSISETDVGAFVATSASGGRHRVSRNLIQSVSSDGFVVLGDENRLRGNTVLSSSVAGVFVDGESNDIRGGLFSDTPIGLWIGAGLDNVYGGFSLLNVPQPVLLGGGRVVSPDAVMPTASACSSDLACDDGNVCTIDACDVATGTCLFVDAPNGTGCSDGDACTGPDQCTDGACGGTPVADGTPCDDGRFCLVNEACQAGVCVGTPFACSDGNECTADTCDETLDACMHATLADGAPCSDGDVCNGLERCLAAACLPGTPIICDDGDPCTTDTCDPVSGCRLTPVPEGGACDDGAFCIVGETCQSGLCLGTPNPCDDANPCTADACDEGGGTCVNTNVGDGASCADADPCDGDEVCQGGTCTAAPPPVCDDANECTDDVCVPGVGCQSSAKPNGTTCAGGTGTCTDGTCG